MKPLQSISLILFSWLVFSPTFSAAQASLELSAAKGRLIHDASYLPPPSWWPPDIPWDGTGLNDDTSYRYGPSIIRYNKDNLHFWACSQGDANVADYIRYKHSSNGGRSWSEEVIALSPTIGSDDGWAICDPNVIRYGGFYYMAYTATDSAFGAGLNNHVFVARSSKPDGNFQKWNGSGWGGDPQPIIRYTGPINKWGSGEPSMVVKGNLLYLYFTEDEGLARTRVATASISNQNWPSTITQRGYAIPARDVGEDQTDIKFLPEVNRFIATAIGNRFMPGSYVHTWQSSDGLRFTPISNDILTSNIKPTAHNLGMSGDYLGHAEMGTKEYLSYAYTGPDGGWGRWNTWLNQATITGAGWVAPPPPMLENLDAILMLLLDEEEEEQ